MEIQFRHIHTPWTRPSQPPAEQVYETASKESFVTTSDQATVGLMPQFKGRTDAEKSRQRTDKVLKAMSSPAATFAIAVGGVCLSALAAAFRKP